MAVALKLVHSAPAVSRRPYATYYYKSTNSKDGDWHRIGHAASRVGALRAAVVKLVTGQYYRAFVHNEEVVVIYRLNRSGHKIEILGQFMEQI